MPDSTNKIELCIFRPNFHCMNFAHFIAKRLRSSSENNKPLPIVNIAIGGIILGMCIMLLSLFIVLGYREAIYTKILGFNRHINLIDYDGNTGYQTKAVSAADVAALTQGTNDILRQEPYAIIGGVATTNDETEAIVLKGVNKQFNWDFLKKQLTTGNIPDFTPSKISNEILISQSFSNRLQVKVGDKLYTHFLQHPPRSRVFKIVGIYNTGISDFDKLFIIGDIRQVQRLYQWDSTQYSGVALTLNDFNEQETVRHSLQKKATNLLSKNETPIRIVSTKKQFAYIFDWLDIMNMNVKIVLFLIVLVSAFNMISALLVIILEKTRHIGLLKALGMSNNNIRKVFIYKSAYIIGRGMLWGNIAGLGIALLQQHFRFIGLNPETYYLSAVPIKIDFTAWLLLNVGVLFLTVCIMILPTILISRIAPAKVIRFE